MLGDSWAARQNWGFSSISHDETMRWFQPSTRPAIPFNVCRIPILRLLDLCFIRRNQVQLQITLWSVYAGQALGRCLILIENLAGAGGFASRKLPKESDHRCSTRSAGRAAAPGIRHS